MTGKDPELEARRTVTVYRTDRGSWVVQGWAVTDPEGLAQMDIPDGESAVEIPDRMLRSSQQPLDTSRGRAVRGAAGRGFGREAAHLEVPTGPRQTHMALRRRGPDDLQQGWCGTLRGHVTAGRSVRRAGGNRSR